MNVHMKFDMRRLQQAIKSLEPNVKKSRKELVEQAAKGFVKTVATVTPPGSKGATGSTAKKQGEAAIKSDLAKVMKAVRARKGAQLQSAQDIYKRFRDKNTGRINPRNLQNPYPVSSAEYNALRKTLLARVGWLASGWNAAAQKLGVKLPAWITRHGTGAGVILVTNDGRRFRIEISNAVKFVGNVKDLDRRIQKAITYQANAMQRQADFLLKKAIKKAGF
jgi:hypothetical protein